MGRDWRLTYGAAAWKAAECLKLRLAVEVIARMHDAILPAPPLQTLDNNIAPTF